MKRKRSIFFIYVYLCKYVFFFGDINKIKLRKRQISKDKNKKKKSHEPLQAKVSTELNWKIAQIPVFIRIGPKTDSNNSQSKLLFFFCRYCCLYRCDLTK